MSGGAGESAARMIASRDLLRAAGSGIENPLRERVRVDPRWTEEIAHDGERGRLLAAALSTLARPQQIWRFTERGVEHEPHVAVLGTGDVCVAGTRRINGELNLHTWFRLDRPDVALRRYWVGALLVYPVRRFRPVYVARRDVLYLHPAPDVAYRVDRLADEAGVLAYVAGEPLPSLVGIELQDARVRDLDSPGPGLANLLRTPCELVGQSGARPLGDRLPLLLSDGVRST